MSVSFYSDSSALLLVGAFLLDLAIGDPRWLPHPVRLMGRAISRGESLLWSGAPRHDLIAGTALTLTVIGFSAAAAWALILFVSFLPAILSLAALTFLASTTLATRGLLTAISAVEKPLRAGDLARARGALAHIVGRDTHDLNQDKVLRAGLESLAESTCDGIIAPLFCLWIGGLPLAMAYKAVSTLDSMIGYRTERYFYFGKCAARLDDACNFLPARLTAWLMIAAAFLLKLRGRLAMQVVRRDHANHLSPNAGYPEAALAGAFGIRLGGPSRYFGREVFKPYIGDEATPAKIEMLKEGRRLCLLTAILSLAIFATLAAARC